MPPVNHSRQNKTTRNQIPNYHVMITVMLAGQPMCSKLCLSHLFAHRTEQNRTYINYNRFSKYREFIWKKGNSDACHFWRWSECSGHGANTSTFFGTENTIYWHADVPVLGLKKGLDFMRGLEHLGKGCEGPKILQQTLYYPPELWKRKTSMLRRPITQNETSLRHRGTHTEN